MSRPRDRWWGYVRACIRAWPELRERERALRQTPITPRYGPGSGGGPLPDPTAEAALRSLPPGDQREYEALRAAIGQTRALPEGERRLALVELVFWRQSHTLEGAARALGWSYRTARRRQNEFIRLVAAHLGLTG